MSFPSRPLLLAVALLATGACARARVAPAVAMRGALPAADSPSPEGGAAAVQWDRQLIRRGDMRLESGQVAATAREVERIGTAMGGRIAYSDAGGDRSARVIVQVPSAQLDLAMDRVGTLGRVTRRHTNAEDVTEQVIDLDARRATLAATRDRLRALLDRAQGINEVITVERELGRVQAELESLERRLTTLRSQAAMSDLTVVVERKVVLGPVAALFRGVGVAASKLFVWR